MVSMYRALFIAFLLAASASTVRGEAHTGADGGTDPSVDDIMNALAPMMEMMAGMATCMADATTECPELTTMVSEGSNDSEYPPSEEAYKNLCGDSCKPAISAMGDCVAPVLQKMADVMKDLPEDSTDDADMADMQKSIEQMDNLGSYVNEMCSKCKWNDHTCMDEVTAKFQSGELKDDSHATDSTFSAGIALLISIAYLVM